MRPKNHAQVLLVSGIILLLSASSVVVDVGAAFFFDPNVTFRMKADPALRISVAAKNDGSITNAIVVFTRIPTPQELLRLKELGTVGSFTGHVATISVPRNQIGALSSLGFVERVSSPKALKPQLDLSVPDIQASRVWNTTEFGGVHDESGNIVDGTGVIVGIADFGIDYLHKDFFFPNGTNKILYIWDQTGSGMGNAIPTGFSYGLECTPIDIRIQSCAETDGGPESPNAGHGTAVASIATSTGQASGKYQGVAPGASIVAVKLKSGNEDNVLDSLAYLVSKARQLGRPLVIDHSLGDSLGSHDGTEPLEIAFSDFVASGVPIVVAAGNSRTLNLHVSGTLRTGESVTVPFKPEEGATEVYVDLWYSPSTTLSIFVKTPRGLIVTGPTSEEGLQTLDGQVIVLPGGRSTGKEWWIDLRNPVQPTLILDQWSFTLTAIAITDGRWDAWMEPGEFTASTSSASGTYTIDDSMTIDAPGNAHGVLTVGSYISKWGWWAFCTVCIAYAKSINKKGFWWSGAPTQDAAKALLGKIAPSSSIGPTRDGRMKPDIVAPGFNVAAARAYNAPQKNSDPDDYHQVWHGTSFAAPHVVGVIALMLQMNPYMSPNEIRTILTDDGRQDEFTGQIDRKVGSPIWGWGKVDAYKSTIDAPKYYSVILQFTRLPGAALANVTVDGTNVVPVSLGSAGSVILEFESGEKHSVEVSPLIQVSDGLRYSLSENKWDFSAGAVKVITYRAQFFLQVNSPRGYPTGTGWYDANSTAVAAIGSTFVDGYEFQGWTGSVNSSEPTAEITMDTSKHMTAVWKESEIMGPGLFEYLPIIIAVVAAAIIIPLGVLFYRARKTYSKDD